MAPTLAVLVLLGWVAYAQGAVVLQKRHVAVPPDTAGPQEVVAAYLDALNAHDCATVRRLADDGSAHLWCPDVLRLAHVKIADPIKEDPSWSGSDGREVVAVPVTFDVDWRLFDNDGSIPEGPTEWGYLLARDSADQPWRITSQGVG